MDAMGQGKTKFGSALHVRTATYVKRLREGVHTLCRSPESMLVTLTSASTSNRVSTIKRRKGLTCQPQSLVHTARTPRDARFYQ